jgi:signal transduction histidine kinase
MMGKMDIKVGSRTKDEIGHLSRMFDEMVVVLEDSRKQLEDHSKDLEKQVQERTIELDKKIKESEQQRTATLNVARDLETLNIDLEREVKTRRKTEKELKKHREHLEELVSKRTAELEEKTKGIVESQQALTFLMEDVNEAREKLERINIELAGANKELEAFSYSVSHDLRAPLRAIKGFSKKLIKNHTSRLDEEEKRLLNVVQSNSIKMEKLIDDLLQFSRVGRSSIRFSDINMNALVTEVSGELKALFKGRSIKFNKIELPSAYGDRSLVKQAFYNLLSNAYKFTKNKKAANIEVGYLDEKGETVYYVKDNGVGFDIKYARKLFNVFQRLHSEKDFPGTGVGLAIVQRIIQRHRGQVWAEAAVDKGAIFFFTLGKRGQEKL